MDLTTERRDGVLCARVAGRIDGANAAAFEQAIRAEIEDGDRAVILDFGNLVYISSAGLRAILMTAKSLLGRGAKFALHSLPGRNSESLRDQRLRQAHCDPRIGV